jgi:acetyl-CoA synthetase
MIPIDFDKFLVTSLILPLISFIKGLASFFNPCFITLSFKAFWPKSFKILSWIMGRVDDVISVSGHRLGTMEIESALVSHKSVAEAAVVGRKDDLKGEAIVAFISSEKDINSSPELVEELKKHVVNEIGIIAKPEKIIISDSLPKTRSGKIMRRILRSLAKGEKISGDISTLEDSSVLEKLKEIS